MVYQGPGGVFFITKIKSPYPGERPYKIYKFMPDDSSVHHFKNAWDEATAKMVAELNAN